MAKSHSTLTTRNYWSRWHETAGGKPSRSAAQSPGILRRLKRGHESHARLVYWHLVDEELPDTGSVIELGCGPGLALYHLCRRTGLRPFGVDYSESGYRRTVEYFGRQGADPCGIMHADFTHPEFRRRHAKRFDVVWSAGVLEHFTNPREVLGYHVELLKPGGTLVVSIPNFLGITYPCYAAMDRETLAVHNLDIMRQPEFESLFSSHPLDKKYCDYVGVLRLTLAVPERCGRLTSLVRPLQSAIDAVLINTMRQRDFPNRFTSPYLLYIGKRTAGRRPAVLSPQ